MMRMPFFDAGLLRAAAAALAAAMLFAGCATESRLPPPSPSFAAYVAQTRADIAAHRRFATADRADEVNRMAPWEMRPEHPDGRAVLFIHGLGDSPWTFRDTGAELVREGILVRTVLLPGHGTRPEAMLDFDGCDWIEAARRELLRLKREGYRVWVGGFSTGGNIAIALADEIEVEGVVLFSPAPYVRTNLVYLVPAASLFFEWLRSPEETGGGTTPVRYRTIPMTGLSAFYDTMRAAQSALAHPSPTLRRTPVFLALAESDSIVDALRVLDAADGAFHRRGSDVLWYGEAAPQTARLPLFRLESRLPKEHVRSFSHLSLNFSPENDYYGRQGRLKRCAGAEAAARSPYLHCGTPEAEVTYGAWGEKRGEGVFVRLTFNPYFRLQTERLIDFFSH